MSVKVAINGFGRIGRNVLRAIYEADDGTPQGWSHEGFADALGRAAMNRPSFGARRPVAAWPQGEADPRPRALYRA